MQGIKTSYTVGYKLFPLDIAFVLYLDLHLFGNPWVIA
jgi:hypothetical protein